MRKYKLILLTMLFFFCIVSKAQPEIKQEYGEDFRTASKWITDNSWIENLLSQYDVPPDEAIAIVFPELMRYSALEDKMEVAGLMVLYTRLGKDYADFSVGRFQMKPSFIRNLELDAATYLTQKEIHHTCPILLNGKDTRNIREMRVNSLTQVKNEVSYLALFYKICLIKFQNMHFKNASQRIRFLATAYNCGYHHSAKYLLEQMKKKQFPVFDNSIWESHENYSMLSLAWWKDN